ncbi:hypothetical protein EYF80_057435 [Liparis tanakae]|uniref:Uncharacterized protein n=1 Tax=Liparis tanakae TaxID=230148 RepID=A0A4Z2EU13_9TELE|nr:hypothetical protein EYF80_057435 [Liparis tanakae]
MELWTGLMTVLVSALRSRLPKALTGMDMDSREPDQDLSVLQEAAADVPQGELLVGSPLEPGELRLLRV